MVKEKEKKYFSIIEIAEKYGVTKQAVHLWIKKDRLKCLKIGKKTFRIPVAEVERLEREAAEC